MTDDVETQEPQGPQGSQGDVSLEERLAAAEAEATRLRDEGLRALAEIENVRKRGERQVQEARVFAIDRFARDLLEVADNLSRALESIPENAEGPAKLVREGVAMTQEKLLAAFTRHGLKQVGAPGDKFDPNLHQAVVQIPSPVPAGAIAEVLQPGYMLAERTLRAAMVAVSLGAGAPAADAGVDTADRPGEAPGGRVDIEV